MNMSEKSVGGVSGLGRAGTARHVSAFAVALVVLLVAIAAGRLLYWAWSEQVSFDGAMNLEAARSLVEGQGYRRMYGERAAFPHEIQTRAPYILPAAAVFAAFGVGVWQAQLTNLLYLFAFAAVAFALVRRWTSWRWGLLAAAVCLATPGIQGWGMNGYGEVPALAWWLSALLILYGGEGRSAAGTGRCFVAGAMIGLAIVTKTVLAIGLFAVLPVFLVDRLWRTRSIGSVVFPFLALVCGALLPLLLHEVWRCVALGGWESWQAWFDVEWEAVRRQAGMRAGFDDSGTLSLKVSTHFKALVSGIGLPPWLVVAWLASCAVMVPAACRKPADDTVRPVLLTLGLFALVYFCWWLGVTPTQKAWYRRIFNGVVAVELLIVFATGLLWRSRARAATVAPRAAVAVIAASLAMQAGLAWSSLADAGNWFLPISSRDVLDRDLQAIRALPGDAQLYGIGWHSVPTVPLYSGRHLDDLNFRTPAELAAQNRIFLVVDPPMRSTGTEQYWLRRFPSRQLSETPDLSVFELATDRVADPFESASIDPAAATGYVDLSTGDYPYAFGFYEREGDGWSWVRPDSEVLLRYAGEPELRLDLYMPDAAYRFPEPLSIEIRLGDCRLGEVRQTDKGYKQWRFPLQACSPLQGQFVRVRMIADNLLLSTADRQMSYILRGIGFETAQENPL